MASCLQKGVLHSSYTDGILLFPVVFYSGPLLDTTLFRGCVALFCTDYRRSSYAVQWSIGGTNTIRREYRSDCGQNSGGSVAMESSGPRIKFQSGYRRGSSILRGGNDIQSTTEPLHRPQVDTNSLPAHLRDLLDQTSRDLDITQQRRLADVLLHYSDLFPTQGSTLTGHTDAVEHDIDTGDSSPIRCVPRRMSPQKMKKEEECVTEMLTGGQIEPSDSPWWSPVVLVTNKDGGTRFCVDYRRLNDVTVKDAYPLPRIDDTLDMLAGKQWFSTLDIASGYWQVSLSQETRVKTAVMTHSGLF